MESKTKTKKTSTVKKDSKKETVKPVIETKSVDEIKNIESEAKTNQLQEFTYVPFPEEPGVDYALKMVNIHKSFNNGAIKANVGMNLYVKRNSVHAIIGENGAGKSTLMSILFGMYEQDIGDIYINNEKIKFKSSKDATAYKIGMVHQHFKLVDNYTVWENIILGDELTYASAFVDRIKSKKAIVEIINKYNFNINVNEKVKNLTVGQQQKVEILKVLYRKSEIMIFDEPTAVLSDSEIVAFLDILNKFKEDGKTIIIITHKLHEVKSIADEATVIRKGRYVDHINVKETSVEKMAELMVGRKVVPSKNDLPTDKKEVVLEVKNLDLTHLTLLDDEKIHEMVQNWKSQILGSLKGEKIEKPKKEKTSFFKKGMFKKEIFETESNVDDKQQINEQKIEVVKNKTSVSFKVHAGEIYAIAGVEGNGQSKLVQQIAGLRKANSNSIYFMGEDITNANINKRIELGMSHVPEDRHKFGLDLEQNVRLNIVNNRISKKPFSNLGFLVDYEIVEYAQKTIDKFDVRGSANGVAIAKSLSGGNQQKVIIGRELDKKHKLIILAQPTRGLDIGAIQYIHNQIIEEKKKGNAILLISYELDEILALADTIAVMSRNKIIEENDKKIMTREHIGQLLAGESL